MDSCTHLLSRIKGNVPFLDLAYREGDAVVPIVAGGGAQEQQGHHTPVDKQGGL